MSPAYLLVVHGSRDPQYTIAVEQLVTNCRHHLGKEATIASAWLELAPTSLAQQLSVFAAQVYSQGHTTVVLLPLFLAPGRHVNEDIPAAIATAHLPPGLKLRCLPALGLALTPALAHLRSTLPPDSILLVHGSRAGGDFFQQLASNLQLDLAYWAVPTPQVPPWLEAAAALAATRSSLGVLLYFLFPGTTTTAIAASLDELRSRFPHVQWQWTPPLAHSDQLVQAIGELWRSSE